MRKHHPLGLTIILFIYAFYKVLCYVPTTHECVADIIGLPISFVIK